MVVLVVLPDPVPTVLPVLAEVVTAGVLAETTLPTVLFGELLDVELPVSITPSANGVMLVVLAVLAVPAAPVPPTGAAAAPMAG